MLDIGEIVHEIYCSAVTGVRVRNPSQDRDTMRKSSLINRSFQLKTTFRIIGIIIIAFIFIIALTGIIATNNNRTVASAISDLNRSIETEKKIVEHLIETSRDAWSRNGDGRDEKIIDSHLETLALMHNNVVLLRKTIDQNLLLVSAMIATGILLGVFLYLYLIRLTHRISGPLYVLTRHMQDILENREPNIRELRKNDEFKEFYEQFIAFIKKK